MLSSLIVIWCRCAWFDLLTWNLQLDKLTQVSFTEYHSKQNFVERVQAEENRMLSKNGPLGSKPLHKRATAGSKEHTENTESVAEEVRST